MPKVKVGDINMYYEVHGEGEPFVMISGIGANLDMSYPVIPVYSREYRLVLFDNRGTGRSDAPDIPYTFKMMADDLVSLLDVIGINSTHIMGTSLGGMIAQEFTLRYPERVRSLILACTSCGGPDSNIMTDPEVIRAMERMQGLSEVERMMELLRLVVSQKFIENNPIRVKQIVELMMKHPSTPQGHKRQSQLVMESLSMGDRLPEIKTPTLVISGDNDKLVPTKNSQLLASKIPNAELVILKGMGHGFMYEAFDETNRIILDFLRRHSSKKA